MRGVVNKFTSDLASGKLSEIGQLGAKIARASWDGPLLGNPAVMGFVLQVSDTTITFITTTSTTTATKTITTTSTTTATKTTTTTTSTIISLAASTST